MPQNNFQKPAKTYDTWLLILQFSNLGFDSARLSGYMQTLIYSAAQNDINPFNYLKAILVHQKSVQENPSQWLPWNYQKNLQVLEEGNACQEGANRVA